MKTFKRIIGTLFFGIMNLPMLLKVQDDGTYLDNLGVQDSAYMQQELMTEAPEIPGGHRLAGVLQ